MIKKISHVLMALIAGWLLAACTQNILGDVASRDSDEAILFDAESAVNARDWQTAIDHIGRMSTGGKTTVKALEVLASAYGGQCGLIFVDYTDALAAATTGSAMSMLKQPFVGVAVDPSKCRSALAQMDLIGTPSARNANQNFFTAILGMVLMGSGVRHYIDNAPAVGDGTNDVDICSGVTNDQVDDIIIGFGYMSQNLSAVTSSAIGGGSLSAITDVNDTCQSAGGSSCQITDPAAITPQLRDFFRDLTNTVEYGVGAVATGGDDLLIPGACP